MGVVIRPVRAVRGERANEWRDAEKEVDEDEDDPIIGWRVADDCFWRSERLAVELGMFRTSLELSVAGAILHLPEIGMLRATECGVTAEMFWRDDARCMYLAAAYCHIHGLCEQPGMVLHLARHALKLNNYWDPGAKAFERGMKWSELNLVSLACDNDGPGDVVELAPQLVELDRRQRIASRLWHRMRKVLDEFGKVKQK